MTRRYLRYGALFSTLPDVLHLLKSSFCLWRVHPLSMSHRPLMLPPSTALRPISRCAGMRQNLQKEDRGSAVSAHPSPSRYPVPASDPPKQWLSRGRIDSPSQRTHVRSHSRRSPSNLSRRSRSRCTRFRGSTILRAPRVWVWIWVSWWSRLSCSCV